MTTTQTIDGVFISRQLAERLTKAWYETEARNELRALLDAPTKPSATAETVATIIRDICEHEPDDNPDSAHISIKALELILLQNLEGMSKPVAQPQGELVGYAVKSELKAALADTSNKHFRLGLDHPAIWAEDTPYGHLVALYAAHPAPVAAVRMCDCNQGRLQCHGSCKP